MSKTAIMLRCRGIGDESAGQGVTLGGAWRRAKRALYV